MKRKKQIAFMRDVNKIIDYRNNKVKFQEGAVYEVEVIQYGITGGFNRYLEDNTMDGSLDWSALVEFDCGRVMAFEIGFEIQIIKSL
jgi:hypothetical protein